MARKHPEIAHQDVGGANNRFSTRNANLDRVRSTSGNPRQYARPAASRYSAEGRPAAFLALGIQAQDAGLHLLAIITMGVAIEGDIGGVGGAALKHLIVRDASNEP